MPETNEFIFSVLNGTVKQLGNPYLSRSMTRFLFKNKGRYIGLSFLPDGVVLEGFLADAGLYLDHEKLSSFCASLKELGYAPITVEIQTYFSTKMVFSVFPRIEIGWHDNVESAQKK